MGLQIVAVTDGLLSDEELSRLKDWQRAGYAGDMSYMNREAELLTTPARLFEGLGSIVVVGAYYDRGYREPLQPGYGRVARYAWGRDYHKVLRKKLASLVECVEREVGATISHRIFADSVPLLERALARDAGLGFVGKNTMVIAPRLGSFMFLSEVLWEVSVSDLPTPSQDTRQSTPASGRCGTCARCIDQCPTGAFAKEYVLDARRCISYLTIEKRGVLSLEERSWIGDWVFGCDICQEVCPFNAISIKNRAKPQLSEFGSAAGVGQALSLSEVVSLRDERAFAARFAGTPLMRAKREGLVRNAAVVAANTLAESVLPDLEEALVRDPSAVVRQHAAWSHHVISARCGGGVANHSRRLLESCRNDPDAAVRQEVLACLN